MENIFKIGVQGVTGKTGRFLPQVIDEFPECGIVATRAAGDTSESFTEKSKIQPCNCWIDFSTPESSLTLCHDAASLQLPVVVATTGFSSRQLEMLQEYGKQTPILLAPNTSLGVFVLNELVRTASILLNDPAWDIEILEIHHNQKKDAPSGTAAMLLDTATAQRNILAPVFDRSERHQARSSNELGVAVVRGGDVSGEHTVYLISQGERIELTHRAWDRKIFARGAIRLAKILAGKAKGYYELDRGFFGL